MVKKKGRISEMNDEGGGSLERLDFVNKAGKNERGSLANVGLLTRMANKCRRKVHALVGGMMLVGALGGCGVVPQYGDRSGDDAPISDGGREKDPECEDGKTRYCFSGTRAEINVGVCREGTQICENGNWGDCEGEVLPSAEICDGKDNNCDDKVDEVCDCWVNEVQYCGSDIGECRKGVQDCIVASGIARWGKCKGEVSATREICDGKDNDCDGNVDEGDLCGYGESCVEGVCSRPVQERKNEIGADILNERIVESDGGIEYDEGGEEADDENISLPEIVIMPERVRELVVEVRRPEFEVRAELRFELRFEPRPEFRAEPRPEPQAEPRPEPQAEPRPEPQAEPRPEPQAEPRPEPQAEPRPEPQAEPRPEPQAEPRPEPQAEPRPEPNPEPNPEPQAEKCVPVAEICNRRDDDCDGLVDEGLAAVSCYNGPAGTVSIGTCKAGQKRCLFGRWTGCLGEVYPEAEICDGKDNDCNGKVDDLVVQKCPYTGVPANTENVGPCKSGSRSCRNGVWVSCSGEISPTTETCNGKDDDCNGQVDDGLVGPNCAKQSGICAGAKKTCGGSSGWLNCSTADYLRHNAAYEDKETKCDGKDNSCDGQIDSLLPKTGTVCTVVGAKGECAKPGKWDCRSATWQCLGTPQPVAEICNDKDDDCDGKMDEGSCHFQASVPWQSCYPPGVKKICYYPFDGAKKLIGAIECDVQEPIIIQKTLPIGTAYVCFWVAVGSNCNQNSHAIDLWGLGSGLVASKQFNWMRFVLCQTRLYDQINPTGTDMAKALEGASLTTTITPALNSRSYYTVSIFSNIVSCFHHAVCMELKNPIK
ncbi:procyclic acidic repetitive family protein [Patescibacteria group bacterium]|nr:procyclic acidic repetitive family protein [Patescibacteria group bacterium]